MKAARLVVLAVALGAGGFAALLATRSEKPPEQPPPQAQIPSVDVLVAKGDISLGQTVSGGDMQWVTWPANAALGNFITKNNRPDAMASLSGSIARAPFVAGEPIREAKLVQAKGSGFMAAILPPGMRAISTSIAPETGAGGFILPNDRVDVILTQRLKNPERPNLPDIIISKVILSNLRVLAIDQAPKEKDGQTAVVGKTVTLELKPEQIPVLSGARQAGTLSLALRSIADVKMVENTPETATRQSENVNIIRFGIPSSATK